MNTIFAVLYARMLWPARDRLEDIGSEDGLETVEYALIAALIATAVIGAVTALRTEIVAVFNNLQTTLQTNSGN